MKATLNETEQLQLNNLKKKLVEIWGYKANYSFNLYTKRTKRDKLIFILLIYPFYMKDGKKYYDRPHKIYKNYENMKSELDYISGVLSCGCELWRTYHEIEIKDRK